MYDAHIATKMCIQLKCNDVKRCSHLYKHEAAETVVNWPKNGYKLRVHEVASEELNLSDVAKETHHVTQKFFSIVLELLHIIYVYINITHYKCVH